MDVSIHEDKSGCFYVASSSDLGLTLGPFPRKLDAEEIQEALQRAYNLGREDVQRAIREALGVQVVHVGD